MIETKRLMLTQACVGDAEALIAYGRTNEEHLRPWEPLYDPVVHYDLDARRERLAQSAINAQEGRSFNFVARFRGEDSAVVAWVNLSNIVRGVFHACYLGYSVDAAHQGTGIGTEAVGAVVAFAFRDVGLHRIMANYQPTNERSARLLRRLGFVVEGEAKDYLLLNGTWQDHILTSLVNREWVPPG